MARKPQHVTDAELAVLQVLWDNGPATIRQLTETLYPGGNASEYATVQKLLERLEGKSFVARDRRHGGHVFQAMLERDELIGRRLRDVAEQLCGGSMTPLLTHLVRAENLTARERQELRALVDDLSRKKKPRNDG